MCGISAFFATKSSTLSEDKTNIFFRHLSIKQDSRGRDNSGIFYKSTEGHNKVVWGADKDCQYYKDDVDTVEQYDTSTIENLFYFKSEVFGDIDHKGYGIAHSRKSSVGGNSIDNAHPVVVGEEGNKTVFVHNGTLYHWRELAKHLGYEADDYEVDSQFLAKAVHDGNADKVFSLMNGAASCVWWTEKEPEKLYFYASASTFTPKKQDRDLHYTEIEGTYFFSSLESHLYHVNMINMRGGYMPNTTYKVKPNEIFCINKDTGDVESVLKVDRKGGSTKTSAKSWAPKPKVKPIKASPTTSSGYHVETNLFTGIEHMGLFEYKNCHLLNKSDDKIKSKLFYIGTTDLKKLKESPVKGTLYLYKTYAAGRVMCKTNSEGLLCYGHKEPIKKSYEGYHNVVSEIYL